MRKLITILTLSAFITVGCNLPTQPKEINRREVRKNRILNTIYLVGVFIFDFMLDTGEWI